MALIAAYGALGIDGLAHYTLALCSEHTLATNLSIWFEVLTGLSLLLASAARAGRAVLGRLAHVRFPGITSYLWVTEPCESLRDWRLHAAPPSSTSCQRPRRLASTRRTRTPSTPSPRASMTTLPSACFRHGCLPLAWHRCARASCSRRTRRTSGPMEYSGTRRGRRSSHSSDQPAWFPTAWSATTRSTRSPNVCTAEHRSHRS